MYPCQGHLFKRPSQLDDSGNNLVRGEGIEPSTTGWKPVILPLNEPRIKLVCVAGFEPAAS